MNSLQQHIDDTYFMRIALQEAQQAYDSHEVPVGAVVVSDRKIIARAHNQVECLKDATAHAEMLALSAAFNHLGGKYLRNCTLYVTLEPCLMCASATFWAKLSRLVFAASDSKLGYTTYHPFNPLHPLTKTDAGILQQASNQVLKTFFKNLRK
jgi:tRNA(adenine34) deaminase